MDYTTLISFVIGTAIGALKQTRRTLASPTHEWGGPRPGARTARASLARLGQSRR
jgi:hypothetical protein